MNNLIKVSLPTKLQIIKGLELVVVTFVAAFSWAWAHSSNPFSRDAVVAAGVAGLAAVYAIVKSLLTTV